MFLYIENEEVKITEAGMLLPVVKALYSTDKRTSGKPFFKKCITYIFWAYKIDGEFCNVNPTPRKERSGRMAEVDYKQLEANPKVIAVIEEYIDLQTTVIERIALSIMKDLENLQDRIRNIPATRKIRVEVKIPYKDSEDVDQEQLVNQVVEVDNWKEKLDSMKQLESIIDYDKKIRAKVETEKKEKKRDGRRKFDRR